MQGTPSDFWAKLHYEDDRVVAWHPLEAHSADVAAVCIRLLEISLLRQRLAALAGLDDLTPIHCERLAVIAALHDVGKFNIGFQNRALDSATPGPLAGHVKPLFAVIGERGAECEALVEAIGVQNLAGWGETPEAVVGLLLSSFAHHGMPYPCEGSVDPRLWRTTRDLDPFLGMRRLKAQVKTWLPTAFDEDNHVVPACHAFHHAFNGVVTLADWIGSSREFFPFQENEDSRFEEARERAALALRRIGLDVSGARASLGHDPVSFESISGGYRPRPIQAVVSDLPARRGPSTTVLEAETGAGKTEAALARYARLFQAGEVDGMYFALPTRTAATQIHQRVTEATSRIFRDQTTRPPVVLAVPGYLKFDDVEGTLLTGFDVLWNDEEKQRWRHRGWAAENKKRYLAGPIVVGTIDQVLLSGLTVPHAHLRASALFRHLLVVDEVHASDAYMTEVLEHVLKRHRSSGGHSLLMSATLGGDARARLIGCPDLSPQSVEDAEKVGYPLVTHHEGNHAPSARQVESTGPEKCVAVSLEPRMEDRDVVASMALEAVRLGAKVLVIRNTVKDCVATQRAIEKNSGADSSLLFGPNGTPAPHHGRFARCDRILLDDEVEDRFGKKSGASACVAIATQTIQQSLDIDADLLITDLSPMDVLLQRIGRLHRHSRNRPKGFEEARVIVLVPEERDLTAKIRPGGEGLGGYGIGSVYEDLRVLEATWRVLETFTKFEVPRDNRMLVERSVHQEILMEIEKSGGERWRKHSLGADAKNLSRRRLAHHNIMRWDEPFSDEESRFPEGDLERRVPTRLGEGDRRLVFETPFIGPFGNRVFELTLPGHLAPEASAEEKPTRVETTDNATTFRFGNKAFRYDRLGLRPIGSEDANDHD